MDRVTCGSLSVNLTYVIEVPEGEEREQNIKMPCELIEKNSPNLQN